MMAGGRSAPDPDGTFDSGIYKRKGDEIIEEYTVPGGTIRHGSHFRL